MPSAMSRMLSHAAAFMALSSALGQSVSFDYEELGADWDFGECLTGSSQSPINFDTVSSVQQTFSVSLQESSTPDSGYVENDGHSMVYRPNTIGAVTLLNPLDGNAEYTLDNVHCHWDDSAERTNFGSEHTLDEASYPLECHFVHFNSIYGDIEEAASQPDGIVVVGQFYEINDATVNADLATLMSAAVNVVEEDAIYNLTVPLAITPLMTTNPDMFAYSGSLTTPTCNEVVQWFVFRTPMGIPTSLLEGLWALQESDEIIEGAADTIEHNWRPTQALNGRTVLRNFAADTPVTPIFPNPVDAESTSGASTLAASTVVVLASAIATIF